MDEKKVREAIEIFKGIEEVRGNLPEDGNDVEEAFYTAIEALEKQLPKKPEMRTAYNDFDERLICYKGFCPSCGGVVESYRNESCHHCTQMLDWSE